MKLSSQSFLSPGHPRDQPLSLSTSRSRRLRTNRSLRGAQSPMFHTGARKRGSGFENPEPSSPKVTCIGQVRVKAKGKKTRTLSNRRGEGKASYRRNEQTREGANPNPNPNQRWVHLPLTICEAVRGIGAEFSCLFPCRSPCFPRIEREREEKAAEPSEGSTCRSSCGAVFARWLVAVENGEGGGRGREIEFVVGGEDEETEHTETRGGRTFRRHGVEEMQIKDEKFGVRCGVGEVEEARVSICVPPKNALLMMRCRSDPERVSALANRFKESPVSKGEEEEQEEEEEEEEHEDGVLKWFKRLMEDKDVEVCEKQDSTEAKEEEEKPEAEVDLVLEKQEAKDKEDPEAADVDLAMDAQEAEEEEISEDEVPKEDPRLTEEDEEVEVCENWVSIEEEEEDQEAEVAAVMEVGEAEEKQNPEENLEVNDGNQEPVVQLVNLAAEADENEAIGSSSGSPALADPENLENEEEALTLIEKGAEMEEGDRSTSHRSSSAEKEETGESALEETEEKETQERHLKEDEETVTGGRSESEAEEIRRERHAKVEREIESGIGKVLPDCLLLMMCEPKLSMEVSKETWVCSTDFIRWRPERPVKQKSGGGDDPPTKRISVDSNPAHHQQPARSSCPFPATAGLSMAAMIEQKLVNAVAYEPFVLTRCKSEPMKTAAAAAAKLVTDTCFWKNRQLEPHRRAVFHVSAAGVGF